MFNEQDTNNTEYKFHLEEKTRGTNHGRGRLISRRSSLLGQLSEEAAVVDAARGVLLKEAVLVLGEAVQQVPLRLRRRPAFLSNRRRS